MPWVYENWELQGKWFGKLSVVTSTPPVPYLQGPLFKNAQKQEVHRMSFVITAISEVIQTFF